MKKNIANILVFGVLLTQQPAFCTEQTNKETLSQLNIESRKTGLPALHLEENHRLITILRDKTTSTPQFFRASNLIATQLAAAASKFCPLQTKTVETPLAPITGYEFKNNVVLVPILRSGLALSSVFRTTFFPRATVGHVGLERHEREDGTTYKRYYFKLPRFSPRDTIIVLDPMLATGGSVSFAIERLIEQGAREENIMFVGVIAATDGIIKVLTKFPNLRTLIISAIDKKLNDTFYIVPGLGDYGDRYFGTEVGVSGLNIIETNTNKK